MERTTVHRIEPSVDRARRRPAAVIWLLALCALVTWAPAPATGTRTQPGEIPEGVRPGPEVPGMGELQVVDPSGQPMGRFPLQHTDVRASVSGQIARVTVEQRFENPYDRSIEAVYIFPLPHEAAVNDLEIQIGERVVRGQIRKRQEAREIYEQAKRQGHVAALLDQERPNIFTQSIANIQPGHQIVVRIRYVETMKYENGGYQMVVPTVVGPRFIPGSRPAGSGVTPVRSPGGSFEEKPPGWCGTEIPGRPGAAPAQNRSGTGWGPDTDRVPDGSRITPPVVPPGMRAGHDIMITVDLDAGVPLQRLHAENHAVDVQRRGKNAATVQLKPSDTIPNKDFILRWEVAGRGPEFGLLCHRDPERSQEGWFTFLLQPEAEVTAEEARPKEMIFLLDASGSMRGEPMAKVKAAVRWALQNLGPDDTFQIIRFSDRSSGFASAPVANTPENVRRALTYVELLRGQGGTHMRAGIEAALAYPSNPERLRLVFFMTDGYIGNEEEILAAVRDRIGDARVFAFGVGSSVNRYLLDKVAEEGRGAVDYVSLQADTRAIVERFYARVARPYLTDIRIDWGRLEVRDVEPARLPDLFAGQPLVLSGRYDEPDRGTITIRGRLGRRDFERRIRVDLPARRTGNEEIGVLWARRRIASLMRQMVRGEQEGLVREVTDTALQFRLVSRYTSFVAADNQVVNEAGDPMLVAQPVEMPLGVRYEGVFGPGSIQLQSAMKMSARLGVATNGVLLPARGVAQIESQVGQPVLAAPPPAVPALPVPSQGDSDRTEKIEAAPRQLPRILPVPPEVEVSVQVERSEVRSGEPVRLRITLRNRGSNVVRVPAQLDLRDGSLAVQVSLDGRHVPPPRLWRVPPASTVELRPGETRAYTVTLNDAGGYAFTLPGRYEIVLNGVGSTSLPIVPPRCEIRVR